MYTSCMYVDYSAWNDEVCVDMRFHCTSILDHVNIHTIVNIIQFSCPT